MRTTITLTEAGLQKELVDQNNTILQTTNANYVDTFKALSYKQAYFETGILPLNGSGVLSIRHALGYKQFVLQVEPGVYPVLFSKDEGGETTLHHVAMPNRVIIGDFREGQFLGARHFYTQGGVFSEDTPLYHVNLPNLNALGYYGTAVGWICLYHTADTREFNTVEQIRYLLERAGGTEVYNNNMVNTDGVKIYSSQEAPEYMFKPEAWEAKTQAEGLDWVNDAPWLPVLVLNMDAQDKHIYNGMPLTLGMAMKGEYFAYYPDKTNEAALKPFNRFCRIDKEDPIFNEIHRAFINSMNCSEDFHKVVDVAPAGVKLTLNQIEPAKDVPLWTSALSGRPIFAKDNHVFTVDGPVFCDEYLLHYGQCKGCNKAYHFSALQVYGEDELFCGNCKTIFHCHSCGEAHDDMNNVVEKNWCVVCTDFKSCDACDAKVHPNNAVIVRAKNISDQTQDAEHTLCNVCMHNFRVCGSCGLMRPLEMLVNAKGEYLCHTTCVTGDPITGALIKINKVDAAPGITMKLADFP
jgi:hypothetical protein